MKKIYLLIAALVAFAPATFAWSGAIHTGIAAIANANLTPEARHNIEQALGNHSIIYYASWLDDVAATDGYTQSKAWHNVAFTAKCKMIAGKKADKSKEEIIRTAHAFDALVQAVTVLQNRDKATAQEIADNIRFVVCILADLHCPSHYVYADRLPQREWQYFAYGKPYNYMKFWEAYALTGTFGNWRATEFVHQLNRKSDEQVKALTAGSLSEWICGNAVEYRRIYSMLTPDQKFDKKTLRLWLNHFYPLSTEYVADAGYRIAALLNSLFDENAPKVNIK